MAICAVAWLVSHVRMLGRDEREKPQTMIRQLVTPLYGEHTLQFYNERYKQLAICIYTHTHRSTIWMFSPVSFISLFPHSVTRVIIMSSIMERMCADIFQQTGATLRPPMDGQESIPYRNLLPAKDPIHMSLSRQFQAVLSKGWVDSQALHLFDSLLNMGGVFWFTNNLVKVRCRIEGSHGLAFTKNNIFFFPHIIVKTKNNTVPIKALDASFWYCNSQRISVCYNTEYSTSKHLKKQWTVCMLHIEIVCGQDRHTQWK